MEWVYSTKGKAKLSLEGYIYGFQKHLANGVSSYEYEMRRNHGCKAKVKIQDDQIVGRLHEHRKQTSWTIWLVLHTTYLFNLLLYCKLVF